MIESFVVIIPVMPISTCIFNDKFVTLCKKLREYFTVTAEKAKKHSAANEIRNRPQRAKFIVLSSVTMYLYISRVHNISCLEDCGT
jgi:hypothetical protein